jgi:hypothetical protein
MNPSNKIPRIAFKKNGILRPKHILINLPHRSLQLPIIPSQRIQNNTPPHNITIPAEDLGKTTNHDIRVVYYGDVNKVPDGLVDYDCEVVFIGEGAQTD